MRIKISQKDGMSDSLGQRMSHFTYVEAENYLEDGRKVYREDNRVNKTEFRRKDYNYSERNQSLL